MSASTDTEKFRKNAMLAADKFRRGVCLKLFSAVILDTPVDTGRAAGNWNTTVGRPSERALHPAGGRASQADAISRITDNLGGLKDSVFLTNNVPYIAFLEYGTPKFTGFRMVQKNVSRITTLIRGRMK